MEVLLLPLLTLVEENFHGSDSEHHQIQTEAISTIPARN